MHLSPPSNPNSKPPHPPPPSATLCHPPPPGPPSATTSASRLRHLRPFSTSRLPPPPPASTYKTARTSSDSLLHEFIGHEQGISDVAFSSDSPFLATASDDKTVCIVSDTLFSGDLEPHKNDLVTVKFVFRR